MQAFIDDGLAVILGCLAVAGAAGALIVLRPWKRRQRHRRRHSRQPRIDLFKAEASPPGTGTDA